MIRQAARHANNRQSGELVVSGVGRGGQRVGGMRRFEAGGVVQ